MPNQRPPQHEPSYLTIQELSDRSRLSVTQLRRMAHAGQITYFQPGGPGGRMLFPPDAIERAGQQSAIQEAPFQKKLSGPRPKWMDS